MGPLVRDPESVFSLRLFYGEITSQIWIMAETMVWWLHPDLTNRTIQTFTMSRLPIMSNNLTHLTYRYYDDED